MRREAFIWTARGMGVALGIGTVLVLAFLALRAANVLIDARLPSRLAAAGSARRHGRFSCQETPKRSWTQPNRALKP